MPSRYACKRQYTVQADLCRIVVTLRGEGADRMEAVRELELLQLMLPSHSLNPHLHGQLHFLALDPPLALPTKGQDRVILVRKFMADHLSRHVAVGVLNHFDTLPKHHRGITYTAEWGLSNALLCYLHDAMAGAMLQVAQADLARDLGGGRKAEVQVVEPLVMGTEAGSRQRPDCAVVLKQVLVYEVAF